MKCVRTEPPGFINWNWTPKSSLPLVASTCQSPHNEHLISAWTRLICIQSSAQAPPTLQIWSSAVNTLSSTREVDRQKVTELKNGGGTSEPSRIVEKSSGRTVELSWFTTTHERSSRRLQFILRTNQSKIKLQKDWESKHIIVKSNIKSKKSLTSQYGKGNNS